MIPAVDYQATLSRIKEEAATVLEDARTKGHTVEGITHLWTKLEGYEDSKDAILFYLDHGSISVFTPAGSISLYEGECSLPTKKILFDELVSRLNAVFDERVSCGGECIDSDCPGDIFYRL